MRWILSPENVIVRVSSRISSLVGESHAKIPRKLPLSFPRFRSPTLRVTTL